MLRQQSDYDPDNDYRRRVAAGVTAFVSSKLTATIPRWGGEVVAAVLVVAQEQEQEQEQEWEQEQEQRRHSSSGSNADFDSSASSSTVVAVVCSTSRCTRRSIRRRRMVGVVLGGISQS